MPSLLLRMKCRNNSLCMCFCVLPRHQHEVSHHLTTDLPCPSVEEAVAAAALVGATATTHATATSAATASEQQHIPLLQLLLDALEVADVASGSGLQQFAAAGATASGYSSSRRGHVQLAVALDERQHGSSSLLHPGLAVAQGPALSLVFHGLVLSPLEVAKLLGAGSSFSTAAAAAGGGGGGGGYAGSSRVGGGGGLGLGGWDVQGSRPGSGSGLKGVWAAADVVQVVSGHYFSLLDPTGGHLGAGVAVGGGRSGVRGGGRGGGVAPGVGRQYDLREGDVLSRFKDQFAPWDIGMAG